jgi:terminase small subunit / prophage DNA-packing protein
MARALTKKTDDEASVTAARLEFYTGMSRQRLHRYIKQGVIERNADGTFPHPAALHSLIEHLSETAAGRGGAGGVATLTAERARLAREQADAAAFKNARERNEFIPAADVERAWSAECSSIRNRLLAIPSALPMRLPHLTRVDLDIVDDEIRTALTELADAAAKKYEAAK